MDWTEIRWQEHPDNPIIEPPGKRWMIADPTVLLPSETPDGSWRMWANSIPPHLHEYISDDGIHWEPVRELCPGGMRPFVRRFGGRYHLFYEDVKRWVPLRSAIVHRQSDDLVRWTSPVEVVTPHLPWHGKLNRNVGNPCVVPWRDEYLLFYSAGTVFLRDCGFVEPRWIGVARSRSLNGPWSVDAEPILGRRNDDLRNLGAGSMKVLADPDGKRLWGFNNGIYRDASGRSRSAIALLHSEDGKDWEGLDSAPIISPSGSGWKKALVYALDVRQTSPTEFSLYFNARSGWLFGKEQIGLATGTLG